LKLKKFRLQKYKRIHDSGWIPVGDLTAFIGKNEAGKSSIFRGLSKLNPSDGVKFNKIKELPRKKLTLYEHKIIDVISAEFTLDQLEKDELTKLNKKLSTVSKIIATRNYDDELSFDMPEIDQELNENVLEYLESSLPKFIYFDNYDVLRNTIDIVDFIQKNKNDPGKKELRMTKCLFDFVGLDLDLLSDLDPTKDGVTPEIKTKNATERRIRCNAAANRMTSEFSEWWKQRRHKFQYNIDSNQFEIFVSDNFDDAEIELEERSAGFQYFFSFFIVFLVESKQKYSNSILLLDEPGLHYHGSFQLELIDFLKKLSKTNQLMYTTHSPFMVDSKRLDTIKSVYEDKDTGYTKVANDGEWPNDMDALFPIRVGWWYKVFNSYIQDKIHLIVEGPTDMDIINAIRKELEKQKISSLNSDILAVPGDGARTGRLVSLLYAQKVKMILFCDSDNSGKSTGARLLNDFGIKFLTTSEEESSIEDLFSSEMYLKAVNTVYPDINLQFTDSEKKLLMITKRLEKLFARNKLEKMNKYRITQELIKLIPDYPECTKPFEKIFLRINDMASKLQ